MTNTKTWIGLFVGGAVAGGALASPHVSQANERRTPCLQMASLDPGSGASKEVQLGNVNDGIWAQCGWQDDTSFPTVGISAMNVHFQKQLGAATPTGRYYVKSCVTYFHAEGGSCSERGDSPALASGSQSFAIGVPLSTFQDSNNIGHFKFLSFVALDAPSAPPVKVKGIWAFQP